MNRNYVLLTQHLFTKRDWIRCDCDAMIKRGYSVKIIQCGEALDDMKLSTFGRGEFRNISQVVSPKCKNEIMAILDNFRPCDLIVSLVHLSKNGAWLYLELRRRGLYYVIIPFACLPAGYNCSIVARENIVKAGICFFQSIRHFGARIKSHLKLFFEIGFSYFLVPPPLFWVKPGTDRPYFTSEGLHLWRSTVLDVESFEVCWYKLEQRRGVAVPGGAYAVFVDEAMRDHPDYEICNIPNPIHEESYHLGLRALFDKIERDLGLKVIVSLHPKASYKDEELDDLFGGRLVVKEGTPSLVSNADLTLMHNSTSISSAALFRKPIMFITNDDMQMSFYKDQIEMRSSWLGQPIINMDHLDASECGTFLLPEVDESLYRGYVTSFIRTPNANSGFVSEYLAGKFETYTNAVN